MSHPRSTRTPLAAQTPSELRAAAARMTVTTRGDLLPEHALYRQGCVRLLEALADVETTREDDLYRASTRRAQMRLV